MSHTFLPFQSVTFEMGCSRRSVISSGAGSSGRCGSRRKGKCGASRADTTAWLITTAPNELPYSQVCFPIESLSIAPYVSFGVEFEDKFVDDFFDGLN